MKHNGKSVTTNLLHIYSVDGRDCMGTRLPLTGGTSSQVDTRVCIYTAAGTKTTTERQKQRQRERERESSSVASSGGAWTLAARPTLGDVQSSLGRSRRVRTPSDDDEIRRTAGSTRTERSSINAVCIVRTRHRSV